MNDEQYTNAAEEIMALVDEFPSELFSLERKFLINKIKDKLAYFYRVSEDDLDNSYDVGYDLGREAECSEHEEQISELENEIEDLQDELNEFQEKLDQAFAEGYESGLSQTSK